LTPAVIKLKLMYQNISDQKIGFPWSTS